MKKAIRILLQIASIVVLFYIVRYFVDAKRVDREISSLSKEFDLNHKIEKERNVFKRDSLWNIVYSYKAIIDSIDSVRTLIVEKIISINEPEFKAPDELKSKSGSLYGKGAGMILLLLFSWGIYGLIAMFLSK